MTAGPSCETCPAFMTAEEAAEVLKKDLGVPMCARFGHLLAKPGMPPSTAQKVQTQFASSCDFHGIEWVNPENRAADAVSNAASLRSALVVTAPDPAVMLLGAREPGEEQPTSCTNCKFYVPEVTVMDELGWNQGLCAGHGRLVLSHRKASTARDCEIGRVGPARDTTTGLHELPVYDHSFSAAGIHVSGAAGIDNLDSTGQIIDPREYPTDREVTPDEVEHGIRAWRRVYNPKGTGQYIDLPVFEYGSFDPDEQAKIPLMGDEDHPEWYRDHDGLVYRLALAWMGLDETPVLWGHAGVGKTELLKYAAFLMVLPFERVSITESTDIDEIAGTMLFTQERGTYWRDGVIPRRWEKSGVLCVDEPNVGPNDVWQFLRPMADNVKQLVVNDTRRDRDPFCFLGLAMNPAWDPTYVGTKELNAADMDRLANVFVNLPPEEVERQIIVQKCESNNPPYNPDPETVDKIMAIAGEIRAMIEDGSLMIPWNIRPQMKVLKLTQFLDLRDAYRMAVTDGMDPETGSQILRIVESYA